MKEGLYIHIPYCRGKCPYCDFFSTRYDESEAREYVDTLISEMGKYNGEFDTIYFGGGTPSILPAEEIGRLISAARTHFTIDDESEITVECNPSKDMAHDFAKYREYGVNRISLGMQSAVDKERFALGRVARREQVKKAITDAKSAGIDNISLDIMLGTPGQTIESLEETLDFIANADIRHISAYMLKIEEGTRFYKTRDRLDLPDDDTVSAMYIKVTNALEQMSIRQYEISNFAIPGYESRHNLKYWELVPYLGIGKTAHSYRNGRRFYYDREMNIIDDGPGGTDEERVMLGLRLTKGIPADMIKKDVSAYIGMGLMREKNSMLSLTPKGMLVSNAIISEII